MAEEKKYMCDTGLIVTQDEDGNYLPFLMRMRSKELVWPGTTADGTPQFSDSFNDLLHSLGVTNIYQVVPTPSYQIDIDGWRMKISDMNHVVYVKEISMTEMERYMHLIYTEDELATGTVTDESAPEDDIDLTDSAVLKRERKFYDANISLPIALKRQSLHLTVTLNATGPKYRTSIVNGNLSEDEITSQIGLTFAIEDSPLDDFDTIDDYGYDGIALEKVEYFESIPAKIENDSYYLAVGDGDIDEIHEFIEINSELSMVDPEIEVVPYPELNGIMGFGSEAGTSGGAILLDDFCYIANDPITAYYDSKFTKYVDDTDAYSSTNVEAYEDGIAFNVDLNPVDPNEQPDIRLSFDSGNGDDVLIVDFTQREAPVDKSTLMVRVEGELADSTIFKDESIHPVNYEI